MTSRSPFERRGVEAFTLIELLVSMAVISVLLLVVVDITSKTGSIWRSTTAKASQFREARDAFEAVTRNLSQATLNTYYDYFDSSGNARTATNSASFVPRYYGRQSELHFISGQAKTLVVGGSAIQNPTHAVFFQAPLGYTDPNNNTYSGLEGTLNTWGYYIDFRQDTDRPPFIVGAQSYRFRLMEFMEPSESLKYYSAVSPTQWLQSIAGGANAHVLAENIIALVILPKLPASGVLNDPSVDPDGNRLSPAYGYDSKTLGQAGTGSELNSLNQLPPIVEVTMIAIDDASADKLDKGSTPPDFGLSGLFTNASPSQRKRDLQTLQTTLVNLRVNFRVFSTEVSLRGAKWSREQVN